MYPHHSSVTLFACVFGDEVLISEPRATNLRYSKSLHTYKMYVFKTSILFFFFVFQVQYTLMCSSYFFTACSKVRSHKEESFLHVHFSLMLWKLQGKNYLHQQQEEF